MSFIIETNEIQASTLVRQGDAVLFIEEEISHGMEAFLCAVEDLYLFSLQVHTVLGGMPFQEMGFQIGIGVG